VIDLVSGVGLPEFTLKRDHFFVVVDRVDGGFGLRRVLLPRLLATPRRLCGLGRFRDDGVLPLVHREQLLFIDRAPGFLSQLRIAESKFGEGDRRTPDIGIRNGLIGLSGRE